MTDTQTRTVTADSPEAALAAYHARREEAVRQPAGPLALVNSQPVDHEQTIWGVRGRWLPARTGLKVIASASDDIVVDGKLVDGETLVRGSDQSKPGAVVFGATLTGVVVKLPTGGYGLRVRDSNSEAVQRFGSIGIFGYNPAWVVTGTFRENPEGTLLGVEHVRDGSITRDEVIPGEISFTLDGVDYNLAVFKSGNALQLVFADATNNVDSYGVGRFLYLAPNPDGTITLDFNRAVLPPCAFSYSFNCPIPPKQNRFPVRIEAGETNVFDQDGKLLHE